MQSDIADWSAGNLRLIVQPTATPGVFAGREFLSKDRKDSRPVRVSFSSGGNFIELEHNGGVFLVRRVYPKGLASYRNAFISDYLTNRPLNGIEGAWLIYDNNYEVGIIRNPKSANSPYSHIGVVLESRISNEDVGITKLFLKQTAAPKLMVAEYKMRDASHQGTNFVIENANYFRFVINEGSGFYASSREYAGIRTYPLTAVGEEPAAQSDNVIATGTGFLISPDLAVTNYHVVQDSRSVTIFANGERTKAFIAVKDIKNDLVVLKLAKPLPVMGLELGDFSSVRIGEQVYTIGFPLSQDLGAKHRLSEGIVSSSVGMQDDPRMFQVSVPIQPGNSGGPLFNRYGEVIGVVTSTANPFFFAKYRDTIPQNIGFAFKVGYLNVLLKEVDFSRSVHLSVKPEVSAADLMEKNRNSVVLIESRN